ncbi:hypothetical protein HNR46_002873 [Haloferula luteola]|uniref:Uncharacterized protein n=1 Tax=Haloferula luteola TaxID=595692 RepID=A0A840V3P8_9BACT|nr:hypothetical protein [Haloferula luteola]MBB5352625.1 hypothetical protein [Haloferula luteola]
MNRNAGVWIWLGVLGVLTLCAAFGGYKVYQKWQARKWMQWEGRMVWQAPEPLSDDKLAELAKKMDENLDLAEVVDPVMEELSLPAKWDLDRDAARAKLREATTVKVVDGQILITVRDREKEMVPVLQKSLAASYDLAARRKMGAAGAPVETSP